MGPSKTCQELHGGQHQLFRRLLQHSDAGSPRSESKGSSSFAVSMRSDAAQMALYAELLLHVGRSQMASYVRREKKCLQDAGHTQIRVGVSHGGRVFDDFVTKSTPRYSGPCRETTDSAHRPKHVSTVAVVAVAVVFGRARGQFFFYVRKRIYVRTYVEGPPCLWRLSPN